ncbi:MAG TPA: hypothetical protein VMX13_12445 [Sedimentisphaerales bacterium]|nr:hypothetical protein [Sedimentisphaerales bacterium]
MENIPTVSSEEELLELRREGKITEAEYGELLGAMRKATSHTRPVLDKTGIAACLKRQSGNRGIPGVLWIGLVSLGIMVLFKLAAVFSVGPRILVDAGISAALLVGLYLGHKWAYILTIVFVVLGTVFALSKGAGYGLLVLVLDCLVLVPVVLSTEYFFFKNGANSGNRETEK